MEAVSLTCRYSRVGKHRRQGAPAIHKTHALPEITTEAGTSLRMLLAQGPVLLVFLRHWGCPFCREMLEDLARSRGALLASGVQVVFVHMGSPERARPYFEHYRLADVERISDPEQRLYLHPAFALPKRAVFRHFLDRQALRAILRGITLRHGIELRAREDRTQMPGAFLLVGSEIVRGYRFRSIADKPDFLKLARLPAARSPKPDSGPQGSAALP